MAVGRGSKSQLAAGRAVKVNCGTAGRQQGVGLAVDGSSKSQLAVGGSSKSWLAAGKAVKVNCGTAGRQ